MTPAASGDAAAAATTTTNSTSTTEGDEAKIKGTTNTTAEDSTSSAAARENTDAATPSTIDSVPQEQPAMVNESAETPNSESSPAVAENGEKCCPESASEKEEKTPSEDRSAKGQSLGPVSEEDLIKPTEGERRKKTVSVMLFFAIYVFVKKVPNKWLPIFCIRFFF